MGGLIAPGDIVGLTAVIATRDVIYSKVTVEGFRVLYVSPEFRAGFTQMQSSDSGSSSSAIAQSRASDGIVVLAVPIALIDVKYDYSFMGGATEIRKVNAVELIAALTSSGSATIILYKVPANPEEMDSPGLDLQRPDLHPVTHSRTHADRNPAGSAGTRAIRRRTNHVPPSHP